MKKIFNYLKDKFLLIHPFFRVEFTIVILCIIITIGIGTILNDYSWYTWFPLLYPFYRLWNLIKVNF